MKALSATETSLRFFHDAQQLKQLRWDGVGVRVSVFCFQHTGFFASTTHGAAGGGIPVYSQTPFK